MEFELKYDYIYKSITSCIWCNWHVWVLQNGIFPWILEISLLYFYVQKSNECGMIPDILVLNTISEVLTSVVISLFIFSLDTKAQMLANSDFSPHASMCPCMCTHTLSSHTTK